MKAEEILGEACWKGYHKQGMKKMFGKKYPNCVKNESEEIEEFIDVNKAPENFDVYADSNGSDYDFTVGKTKIEVTFKEYNENYYILAFENTTQRRPDTHATCFSCWHTFSITTLATTGPARWMFAAYFLTNINPLILKPFMKIATCFW